MKPAEIYILNQQENFREILYNLQVVIEKCIPNDLQLLYKWKLPFYYYKGKPFCYFNVSYKNNYVDLGIFNGYELTNTSTKLISENRSMMKSLRYYSLEELDNELLVEILEESLLLLKKKNRD